MSFKAGIDKIVLVSFTLAFSCLLFFSFYTYGRLEKRLALQAENASIHRDLFYVFLITSACTGLFLIVLYLIVHSSLSGKKEEQERLRKDAEEKVLKANRLYATISEVNKAIVYADSPERLFRDICNVVVASGKFRMAWIGLIDKESRMVVPVNHAGYEEGYLSTIRISVDNVTEGLGPTGHAIREGRHYVCNDIGTEPAMRTWRQEALSRGYRSSIALPVIKSGEPFGSFSLYSHEENFFDREEIQLLDEVVQDMSFALEAFDNEASLRVKEEEIRDMNGQLRDLASNLQNIREEERTYIAREIHDELGQQLTAIKLDVAWLDRKIQEDSPVKQRIGNIISMLSNVIHSIRKIAMQLRPSVLDDLGLIEALKWQSRDFQNRYAIPIAFEYPEDQPALTTASVTGLFRIFQEALTNIARHAEATAITAGLCICGQQLVMTIADNGKGFDITAVKKKKTLGLLGMKERTLMMKGTYEIISQPGKGTSLSISIPLDTHNKST
jgi:signal transduction histidine kinase